MPAKRGPIDVELAALNRAPALASDEAVQAGRLALASRHPPVVARAAQLAGELSLRQLEPDLIASYQRLAVDPEKLDPVCAAMKEISATLFALDAATPEVYLHAVRHAQLAGWDNQDVGAPLRGVAVQALVRIEHPAALTLATDMVMDGLPASAERDDGLMARIGAVKALRAIGSEASAHVLRLKVRAGGEPSAEVYAECFGGMLEYSPIWGERVAEFLTGGDEGLASLAAIVIGEHRPANALAYLTQALETTLHSDLGQTFLDAVASLRSDEAVDYLIGLIGQDTDTAIRAISALRPFSPNDMVRQRVREAAASNRRAQVLTWFEHYFR